MTADKKIRSAIQSIFAAQLDEANCEECFEQLDQFVELVQSGADAAKILPRIEEHLGWCRDCGEEYQALLSMLRGSAETD